MITVQKIVIDIFMYIFEALLLWYYANTAFDSKKSKLTSLIFIIIAHVV